MQLYIPVKLERSYFKFQSLRRFLKRYYGIFFGAVLLFTFSNLQGQNADTLAEQNSAYDLLSKYYEDGFKPFSKGNWYVGFAFSLTDQQRENTPRLLDRVVEGSDLNYDLTFKGGYFIGNYAMVGANFLYSRDKFTGTLIIQDTDTVQRNTITSVGTIAPTIKTYFPLTKNERLSFFNEVGVGFGFGNTVTRDIRRLDEINKTYTEEFVFTAGISPGITFFAIENFAFEVQLNNLIGYELKVENTTTNETEKSNTTTHNVNFQIDLLSLNLGLAYYFGVKKN